MKRILLIFKIVLINLIILNAQSILQKPFIIIDDTIKIYADEFINMYKKNKLPNDTLTPEQYLDLFINYKLKVLDAIENGYDKDSLFITEYEKYLLQAAEDRFIDHQLEKKLLNEYYQWLQTEVKTSFITKYIPKNASAKDTLKLYNELLNLRERALQGENFNLLAVQYSDAPRAKIDSGNVGYLTIFDIPAIFLRFVWTGKIGDISLPLRYMNRYYIIKITGRRPAKGKYHVKQIFVALPLKHSKQDSIIAYKELHEIDSLLKAGVPFEEIAKQYSDDPRSSHLGGDMGWLRPGQTVKPFENAIFSLSKPGEITGPIRTSLGFHYIKLVEKEDYKNFEKQKNNLIKIIRKSPDYRLVQTSKLDSLKKIYKFKMLGSLDSIFAHVDNSIFSAKWDDSILLNNHKPLFEINGKIYTYSDFAKYLKNTQRVRIPENPRNYVKFMFDNFVYNKVKKLYVKDLANNRNNDFYYLAKEFYEGLLLFNIANDRVWKRTSEDTTGLKLFYEQHRDKYNDFVYISIIQAKNQKSLKKAKRILRQRNPKVLNKNFISTYLDTNIVFIESKLIKKDIDTSYSFIFDRLEKKPKQKIFITANNQVIFVNDKFNNIRGQIITDYQIYLDKKWINELRKKHKIAINNKQEVFNFIKNEN